MTATLPAWAAGIVNAIQPRGNGLHRSIFRAAIALRRCGWDESDIHRAIDVATAGQPLQPDELDEAIRNSANYMTTGGAVRKCATTRWPAVDPQARQKIIDSAGGFADADLWESSPIKFPDADPRTSEIIDVLFPADCLLCVGKALDHAITRPREALGDLSKYQFIVPSPMSKPIGKTKDGRQSFRCLDNTGQRRHLVVEQDAGTPAEQAAIIGHLAHLAPLVMVLRSGGKSLHAWFRCEGATPGMVKDFFTMAVRVGADPATWTACQYVRCPDGLRRLPSGDAARQSVLYFAPDVARGRNAGN